MNVTQALAFGYWSSIWRAVLISLAAVTAYIMLGYFLAIADQGEKVAALMREQVGTDLFVAMFVVFPLAATLSAIACQGLIQRFVLPISNRSLLINTLLHTTLMSILFFYVTAGISILIFDYNWSLVKPMIVGFAVVIFSIGVAHLVDEKKTMGGIAWVVSSTLGIVSISLADRSDVYDTTIGRHDWNAFSLPEIMYALVLVTTGVALLNWRLKSRSYASEWRIYSTIRERVLQGWAGSRLPDFSSARHAYAWHEWRVRGAPLVVITLANAIVVGYFVLVHPNFEGRQATTNGLAAVLYMWVCFGFFYGLYIVHRGQTFEYFATLPISHRLMADQKLKTTWHACFKQWMVYMVAGLTMIHLITPITDMSAADVLLPIGGNQNLVNSLPSAILIASLILLLVNWTSLAFGVLFGSWSTKTQFALMVTGVVVIFWSSGNDWPLHFIPEFVMRYGLPYTVVVYGTFMFALAVRAGMARRVIASAFCVLVLMYLSRFTLLENLSVVSTLAVCMMPVLTIVSLPLTIPALRQRAV